MWKKIKGIFSFSDILFLLLFLYIIIYYGNGLINKDTDILWHIKQGEWMLENKKIIIDKEIFTYLFDYREWIYLSWLSDIIFAFLYKIAEFRGVIVLTSLLLAGYVYLIFRYITKTGEGVIKSLVIFLLTMPLLQMSWISRSYIFSYFFMVIWFILIDKFCSDNKNKGIFFLPLLQILWVNIHSSFLYGFIVGGMYFLGEFFEYIISGDKEKKKNLIYLFIVGCATALTALINPFSYKIYSELFENKTSYQYSVIQEYQSIDFHCFEYLNFYIVFFILILIFFRKERVKMAYIFLILFWLFSGLEYIRHVPIFAVFSLLILSKIADFSRIKFYFFKQIEKIKYEKLKIGFKNFGVRYGGILKVNRKIPLMTIIAVLICFYVAVNKETAKNLNWNPKPSNSMFGIEGVKYIKKSNLKGRIYNDYLYGGYMNWELYPERTVFMDPRASIYPKEIFVTHRKIHEFDDETFELLNKYQIKYIFISKNSVLAEALKSTAKGKYKEIYSDKNSIIYEKIESAEE